MPDIQEFINTVEQKTKIDNAINCVAEMRRVGYLFSDRALDSMTAELLKARREADRRLARAITEFEQITRNERED